jgi:hypothetical protein
VHSTLVAAKLDRRRNSDNDLGLPNSDWPYQARQDGPTTDGMCCMGDVAGGGSSTFASRVAISIAAPLAASCGNLTLVQNTICPLRDPSEDHDAPPDRPRPVAPLVASSSRQSAVFRASRV